MIEQELTYQDLRILSSEIYEAMGYKDSIPDQMVIDETNTLLKTGYSPASPSVRILLYGRYT